MKSVIISIRPKWCEKIVSGKKTIEVRKTAPKEVPFKCYIYMTQGAYKDLGLYSECIYQNRMKVIGEFICNKITRYNCDKAFDEYFIAGYIGAYMPLKEMCLTNKDLIEYGKGRPLYGWHISNLKIYDKPLLLSELGVNRPPQSYMFVEELKEV